MNWTELNCSIQFDANWKLSFFDCPDWTKSSQTKLESQSVNQAKQLFMSFWESVNQFAHWVGRSVSQFSNSAIHPVSQDVSVLLHKQGDRCWIISCPLECSIYPEGARREDNMDPHTLTHTNSANCRHSCKRGAHTLYVTHYFTWDALLVIELWSRDSEEEKHKGWERAREVECVYAGEGGRLADRLTESSERRKESEIFSHLSVRVLMWFKGFFMLRNFEGEVFDVWFASLLAIGLISLPSRLPAIYLISATGLRHCVLLFV